MHGEHPKCLIKVDETTTLDHRLEALSMAGVREVAIVVGSRSQGFISSRIRHSNSAPAEAIARTGFIQAVPTTRIASTPARHLLESGRYIDWAFVRGPAQIDKGACTAQSKLLMNRS